MTYDWSNREYCLLPSYHRERPVLWHEHTILSLNCQSCLQSCAPCTKKTRLLHSRQAKIVNLNTKNIEMFYRGKKSNETVSLRRVGENKTKIFLFFSRQKKFQHYRTITIKHCLRKKCIKLKHQWNQFILLIVLQLFYSFMFKYHFWWDSLASPLTQNFHPDFEMAVRCVQPSTMCNKHMYVYTTQVDW